MLLYNETTEEVCKEEITVVKTRLERVRDALIEHFLNRGIKLIVVPTCERKRFVYEPKFSHGVKQPHIRPIIIGAVYVKSEKGLSTYSGKSFTTNVEWPDMRSQVVKKLR